MTQTHARVCKIPIFGAWIGILQPNVSILKCSYYKNYCIDHNQILHSDRDPQVLTVGRPNLPQTNPIWRRAAIFKIEKILISSQPIDRFWQNLARRCVSTRWILINNKISQFQKSKMAAAAILKIRKIAISPQRNDQFWRNLEQLCVWALQTPSANKISQIWKSKMAAATILKNLNIFATDRPILTKFGTQMRLDPQDTNSQ